MKVLFVCSGNSGYGISPIISNQAKSLKEQGILVDTFAIEGKGLKGYLSNIIKLRSILKRNKYDLVHSHYSLTAYVASFAGAKPLVVSLMGSDVLNHSLITYAIKLFAKYWWAATIVKSTEMKKKVGLKMAYVIPNGVDIDKFYPKDKNTCIKKMGWDISKKHILFAASKKKTVKNWPLAFESVNIISDENLTLHSLENVPNGLMPDYYNASDLVILVSLWEGSPNVIKEAMACNCPIVSTNVGDVQYLLKDVEGSYVTKGNPNDLAINISKALLNYNRTDSRKRIIELSLDSSSVARRLIKLYESIETGAR